MAIDEDHENESDDKGGPSDSTADNEAKAPETFTLSSTATAAQPATGKAPLEKDVQLAGGEEGGTPGTATRVDKDAATEKMDPLLNSPLVSIVAGFSKQDTSNLSPKELRQ